ncbi:MAG TPA: hypothetical protein VF843_06750 [Streptosporangiaceae bacterium]
MRNAGDRVAGGSSGRRQRPASPEPPQPAGHSGGASLFTPAYRVSHGPSGTRAGDRAGSDAGRAATPGSSGPAGQDYSWSSQDYGYGGGYDTERDVSWIGDGLSAGFGWGDDDPAAGVWPGGVAGGRGQARRAASNAVRGFPPAPGEPLPVYPPGPFEAWNRSQDRTAGPRGGDAYRAGPDDDASQLAIATITPDEFDTDYSLPAIKDPIPGQAAASAGAALAGRETLGGPGTGGPAAGGTRTAPDALPGQPVRRGGEAARAGGGHGHRAAGRSRSGSGRPAEGSASAVAAAAAATTAGESADGARQASPATPGRVRDGAARTAAARPRRNRRSHWFAIVAAVLIIVAVAATLVYSLPKHNSASPPAKPQRTSSPTPSATGPTSPPGPWGFIGARKTDAIPLSMAEMFPPSISDGTTTYTRARQVIGKNCHASVVGAALQAAVKKAGCNQSLRATYLSKSAKVMGTIGVYNLKNAAGANKAAAKAGHSQFVTQLAAKAGPAKSIGQGAGLEEALVKGHYLVLVWAEPTNVSASPSGKNKARLNAFMTVLVAHTVNVSLSYRMVEGKPPPAG